MRDELGLFAVEGAKMIRDAFSAGVKLERLFVAEDKAAEFEGVWAGETYLLTPQLAARLSGTLAPQGAVAAVRMPQPATLADAGGFAVVLDGVTDPGNLGTIVRTCAAFGVKSLFLRDCCDIYNPKCVRSSMSGIFHVKTTKITRAEFTDFAESGYRIVIADMGGADVETFVPGGKILLVLGSEAHGVSAEIRALSSAAVSVKIGGVESLNVAAAAAILIYKMTNTP